MQFYLVGGAVRDKLMGKKPNDFDYVFVGNYEDMKQALLARNANIRVENPQFVTIRATMPNGSTNDYVCARKDGIYSDGRRPDTVSLSGLEEDLSRRDFTINAMAQDEQGDIYDPFGGQQDLKDGLLLCVGSTRMRFEEDSLRMLRAIRFAVTKRLQLSSEISFCLSKPSMVSLLRSVSVERVYEELKKMFAYSTNQTLLTLQPFPYLQNLVFSLVPLEPTLKRRAKGVQGTVISTSAHWFEEP